MSWDTDPSGEGDLDPVSSVDLAEFESTGRPQPQKPNLTDSSHPEYMEVVSVTPGHPTATSARSSSSVSTDRQEPLLPAKLRPSKEKTNHHSKAEERGDRTPRKKMVSPTKPMKGKLSPPGGSQGRVSPGGGKAGSPRSSGSSMDETVVTPLASTELVTPRSVESATSSSESSAPPSSQPPQQQQQQQQQQARPASRSGYEAFIIPPDSNSDVPIVYSPRRTASSLAQRGEAPAGSYTLETDVRDSQTAREAGLPVIGQGGGDDGEVATRLIGASREGSVGSSRSSGDFSDHESHKIHQDHKARESLKHSPRQVIDPHKLHASALNQPQVVEQPKHGELITDHLPEGQKKPGTTSFAEIRRMKGVSKVDNSGYVYMQHGQEPGGDASGHTNFKSSQRSDGGGKKATFARLPNETTWQQSAQRNAAVASASTAAALESPTSNGDRPGTSELSQLRLKLEEKRREIERRKQRQEVQSAKMRQRLGKAAFMRVISKKDDGEGTSDGLAGRPGLSVWRGGGGVGADGTTVNHSPLSQAVLQERLGQISRDEPTRPTTLPTHSPASSNSTSASESPSTAGRAFSREGIQQTIDGVRRRWFHGSDPEGELINSKNHDDEMDGIPVSDLGSDMMQSCPPSVAAAAFGYSSRPSSSLSQEARASPVPEPSRPLSEEVVAPLPQKREMSQSPRRTPERRVSGTGSGDQEDYDQSLDKLNRSLTELQGEIKRLSLQQQEQFRAAQSPQGPCPDSALVASQGEARSSPLPTVNTQSGKLPCQPPSLSDPASHLASPSLVPMAKEPSPPSSTASPHPQPSTSASGFAPTPYTQEVDASSLEDDTTGNGFFVSFGEDTPRRPKPKLGKDREAAARKDSGDLTNFGVVTEVPRVPPPHGGVALAAGGELGSSHSGSHHSLQSGSDDSSSGVGFVLGQESQDMVRSSSSILSL